MFSNKIKEGMKTVGVTYKELGEVLELTPSTVSYRVNRNYKPWSVREILKVTQLFQSKGFNLYPEQIYADILREIDVFEDLFEYVPLSKKEISEQVGLSYGTLSNMLSTGVTDIKYIQELKKIITATTLFRIRERYW